MTEDEAKGVIAERVSRETMNRLSDYATLLIKWQSRINLIARSTSAQIWSRHMLDSAQLLDHIPEKCAYWLDLGSGGGFPGLVCAAIAHEHHPEVQFALVEADQRKATFLREASRHMRLSVEVHNCRILDLAPQSADVISARALAPLAKLCEMAHIHLAPAGICLFPKGARHADEYAAASKDWLFAHDLMPSVTETDAAVLKIKELRHV